MIIDPLVAKFFIGLILVLAGYKLYLDTKQPKLKTTLPQYRSRPLVITEVGIRTIAKKTPLSPNKYLVEYAEPDGYRKIYTRTGNYDDLVPMYPDQVHTGESAPVLIEVNALIERSYGYEDATTRKLLKARLAEITRTMQETGINNPEAERTLTELAKIARSLTETPNIMEGITKELGKETAEKTRMESAFITSQAGIEGKVERRAAQFERLAAAGKKQLERPERS